MGNICTPSRKSIHKISTKKNRKKSKHKSSIKLKSSSPASDGHVSSIRRTSTGEIGHRRSSHHHHHHHHRRSSSRLSSKKSSRRSSSSALASPISKPSNLNNELEKNENDDLKINSITPAPQMIPKIIIDNNAIARQSLTDDMMDRKIQQSDFIVTFKSIDSSKRIAPENGENKQTTLKSLLGTVQAKSDIKTVVKSLSTKLNQEKSNIIEDTIGSNITLELPLKKSIIPIETMQKKEVLAIKSDIRRMKSSPSMQPPTKNNLIEIVSLKSKSQKADNDNNIRPKSPNTDYAALRRNTSKAFAMPMDDDFPPQTLKYTNENSLSINIDKKPAIILDKMMESSCSTVDEKIPTAKLQSFVQMPQRPTPEKSSISSTITKSSTTTTTMSSSSSSSASTSSPKEKKHHHHHHNRCNHHQHHKNHSDRKNRHCHHHHHHHRHHHHKHRHSNRSKRSKKLSKTNFNDNKMNAIETIKSPKIDNNVQKMMANNETNNNNNNNNDLLSQKQQQIKSNENHVDNEKLLLLLKSNEDKNITKEDSLMFRLKETMNKRKRSRSIRQKLTCIKFSDFTKK